MDTTECLAVLLGELASIGQIEPDVARLHHSTARIAAISRLRVLARWMDANGAPPDVDAAIETFSHRRERGIHPRGSRGGDMTRAELLERLEQALKAEAFEEAREYQALLDELD